MVYLDIQTYAFKVYASNCFSERKNAKQRHTCKLALVWQVLSTEVFCVTLWTEVRHTGVKFGHHHTTDLTTSDIYLKAEYILQTKLHVLLRHHMVLKCGATSTSNTDVNSVDHHAESKRTLPQNKALPCGEANRADVTVGILLYREARGIDVTGGYCCELGKK